MADAITRPGLQNTIRQVQEASGSLDAEEKARQKKAIKLFSDFTSGSSGASHQRFSNSSTRS